MALRSSTNHKLNRYNNPTVRKELPHLKNVFKRSSNQRSDISVYHYDDDWNSSYVDHRVVRYPRSSDLTNIIFSDDSDCKRRVILIEDICKELVDELIDLLDINPEFFENHLVGARLPNEGSRNADPVRSRFKTRSGYSGPEATEWTTRRLKKDFRSVKWYRPYALRLEDNLVDISERLVKSRGDFPDEWRFDCNIWRRHAHFQADGATWSFEEGESIGLSGNASLAYEERCTVWHGSRQGFELIITLTDTGICSALHDRQSSQPLSRPTQMYLVRKSGKEHVTKSRMPESTRLIGSDIREDTDSSVQEKEVLDDGVRDASSLDGVLTAENLLTRNQSGHTDTDLNSRDSQEEILSRGDKSEQSITQDPRIFTRSRGSSYSDVRSIRKSTRSDQAIDDTESVGSKSNPRPLIGTSEPNSMELLDQDSRADTRSNRQNEFTTSGNQMPIRFADQNTFIEAPSHVNAMETPYTQSASLEELLRLDSDTKVEKPEHIDSETSGHMEKDNLPPLPPSTPSVQDSMISNVRPSGSHRHIRGAFQTPLPRSSRNHVRGRDESPIDQDYARLRYQASSLQSRPLMYPSGKTTSTAVLTRRNRIVRNIASRCPVHDSTLEEAQDQRFLRSLTSTREDIGEWFRCAPHQPGHEKLSFGPVTMIYSIIHHDTLDFLLLIDEYLDIITAAADDEIILERNIVAWRRMLWFFGKELRSLSNNLSPFAMFLLGPEGASNAAKSSAIPKKMLKELTASIAGVQKRLEITFGTLVSSISVVEARKAITETESVTRLTELAFVYIPLSFAASFFGMQVKELDPSSTSISGFFGLGAGITLLSYSIRLVIRSDNIKNMKRGFVNQVRTDSDTSEGVPIRTRDAIRFMIRRLLRPFIEAFHRFENPILLIILGSSPIIPMITIWARAGLTGSMKLAISVVFVLIIAMMVMGWLIHYVQVRVARYSRREREEEEESLEQVQEDEDE